MSNKLFVQNFSAAVDSFELESWFSTVGDVASATVKTLSQPSGDLRVGYIQMETAEQAADCIDRFNGKYRDGLTLIVREDKIHVPGIIVKKAKIAKIAVSKRQAKA